MTRRGQWVLAARLPAALGVMVASVGCSSGDDGNSAELQSRLGELEAQISDLESENAQLRTELSAPANDPPETTDSPTVTERETTVTERETTTTRRETTTTASPSTTTPAVQGLLWTPPSDEGIGTFSANDTVTRLTAVFAVDTTQHTGELAVRCQAQIDFEVEHSQWTDPPTYCLVVQWSFDVGPSAPVSEFANDICLSPDDMVSLDGRQVDKEVTSCALPGTRDNQVRESYAGGGPGSVLRFRVGNREVRQDYQVPIPGAEAFVPYTQ